MKIMKYLIISVCALVFPAIALAQVEITEIMYDLEGSDADGEWIEVYNSGADVDLTTWRFFENDTNHRIEAIGSSNLPKNSYAVIADNPSSFQSHFPSYSGLLFDSSFSLHNEGELLEMRDADLTTQDSLTYTSSWGASGTGESLQKSGNSWSALPPTPGESAQESSTPAENETEEKSISSDTQVPSLSSTGGPEEKDDNTPQIKLKPRLVANAGADRRVFVGAKLSFSGDAVNERGRTEDGVTFNWNFGDGTTAEGRRVSHVYKDSGKYVVALYAYEDHMRLSDTDEIVVEVVEADIDIEHVSFVEGTVKIVNNSGGDVDLSGWHVIVSGVLYTLPDFTHILKDASVTFRLSETPFAQGSVMLQLPSGQYVSRYENTPKIERAVYVPREEKVSVVEEEVESAVVEEEEEPLIAQASVLSAVEETGGGSDDGSSVFVWFIVAAALGLVGGMCLVALRREREKTL